MFQFFPLYFSKAFWRILYNVQSSVLINILQSRPLTSVTFPALQASKEFSWDNYGGLKDFYGLTMPKWKLIGWVWEKPEEWTEDEWQLFEMWAEEKWNQKEDWRAYTDKWTDDDWVTFKRWMDFEYKEYMKDHTPLHQDIFIR